MSFDELITQLTGSWSGEYKLWLNPNEEPAVSKTTAKIEKKILDNLMHMEYTWEDENKPCEGILMMSYDSKQEEIILAWFDSWHQKPEIMISRGSLSEENHVSAKGSYKVSKGPNWEWRTKIIPVSSDEFIFEMYNILPEGQEHIAVRVEFSRK